MAVPLHMKRMARERRALTQPNPDYFVSFADDNLLKFDAYVLGPADTLYAHKFLKLRFEIPDTYPFKPPKCTFIQHTGGRIHPNLYVEGKVCLSILGTWPGEPWAYAMTIDTVLITIRSLLDNSPYKHEPHQSDNPAFNQFVQYTTWRSLLLDYLQREADEAAKEFLQKHVCQHGAELVGELTRQTDANTGVRQLSSPYGGKAAVPDYQSLLRDVRACVEECQRAEALRAAPEQIVALAPASESSAVADQAPTPLVSAAISIPTSALQEPVPQQPDDWQALAVPGQNANISVGLPQAAIGMYPAFGTSQDLPASHWSTMSQTTGLPVTFGTSQSGYHPQMPASHWSTMPPIQAPSMSPPLKRKADVIDLI